jgi:ribose transport system ATP-binding protein
VSAVDPVDHEALLKAVLEIDNLSKTFPGTVALRDVDLTVRPGEIRALVGMNGSGKSTLVKILAGFHTPDPGSRVQIGGEPLRFGTPGAAEDLGLRFVHQDLALLATLSVTENIALVRGYASPRHGPINWRREADRAAQVVASVGYAIDVDRLVGSLTPSEQAAVAIVRALAGAGQGTRALILDEPTATMPAAEVERFMGLVEAIALRGIGVIYISHHLDEVLRIAHSVTVLRDGQVVLDQAVRGLRHDDLVGAIIGSRLTNSEVEATPTGLASDTVLELTGITGGRIRELSLTVHAGEILGVAGVVGSGREDVCRVVLGEIPHTAGRVRLDGKTVPIGRPDMTLDGKMAFVPANRRRDALFPGLSVRENLIVDHLSGFHSRRGIDRSAELAESERWIRQLNIKTPSTETPIALLSGGNQQKVIFARVLRQEPRVLLLDDPTQGIDVGTKKDIYELIHRAADGGTAILVASTDSEDLARVCSRVLVIGHGRCVAELRSDEVTEANIDEASLMGPRSA